MPTEDSKCSANLPLISATSLPLSSLTLFFLRLTFHRAFSMNNLIRLGNPLEVAASLQLKWDRCAWDPRLPFRDLDLSIQPCSLSLRLPGCLTFYVWKKEFWLTLDLCVLIYLLAQVDTTTVQTSSSSLEPGRHLILLVWCNVNLHIMANALPSNTASDKLLPFLCPCNIYHSVAF